MRKLLERIYPLHRTLASDGTEQALAILGEYLPASYRVLGFNPGEKAWTWTIPPKYVVREAYLEFNGTRLIDFANNPLHLVSYSEPIDAVVMTEDLVGHLHYNEERPNAIPWKYSYYKKDWGFCLPFHRYANSILSSDRLSYHVCIDASFDMTPGAFKVGECFLPGQQPNELMILAHICHPNQANDDAAGVAVAVEVARRLAQYPLPPGSMGVRFLFMPETIGTITYLSHNEDLIPRIRGGIFVETPGAGGTIAVQHTLRGDDLLDRMARLAPCVQREAKFTELAANDERVLSAPNVNIPCISFTRSPYPEYHTSDDNLSIIRDDYMLEMANTVEYTARLFASNYVPVPLFTGPVFLTRYGLFVDWGRDWAKNRFVESVMMNVDARRSVFELAEDLGADYWDVRQICESLYSKKLISRGPIK